MSCSALGRRLVACLLNISEARRRDLVETVARSAITDTHGETMHAWFEAVKFAFNYFQTKNGYLNVSEVIRHLFVTCLCDKTVWICLSLGNKREGITVLNIFNDVDYNRSVITIVASIDLISELPARPSRRF